MIMTDYTLFDETHSSVSMPILHGVDDILAAPPGIGTFVPLNLL